MSQFKSHFTFTKQQRSGIFVLLMLILIFQCLYFFVDIPTKDYDEDSAMLEIYLAEIDSLKLVKLEESKPKTYPFNPNFITDFKGYSLGMSNEEIDRLHRFRNKNQWVNSAEEFQKVTKVSDSLLKIISPYFKFPDWVTNPKPKKTFNTYSNYDSKPKTFDEKVDLNVATASQLRRVNGIGEKLSERIVKYRIKSGGFVADVQLQEVYGLSPEVIARVLNDFTVKSAKTITKISINTATIEELVTIKYIDYEIAYNIIEQRTLRKDSNHLMN